MSQALTAALAPELDLPDGYVVTWAAIDPSTGADIANVKVSGVSLFGTSLGLGASGNGSGSGSGAIVGPYMLVPGPGA